MVADTISTVPTNAIMPESAFRAQMEDSGLVIRGIELQVGDVIPPWSDEALGASSRYERLVYDMANWIHIRTKPHVIASELLFAVGDSVDSLILAETERNLRAYSFINEAEVKLMRTGPDEAVARVRTSDNFSLSASLILERGGGKQEIGGLAKEYNVLGFGKQVSFQYNRITYDEIGNDETVWMAMYIDPRLFGSRWQFDTYFRRRDAGDEISLGVQRPFYAQSVRNAGGINIRYFDGQIPIYVQGVVELPRKYRYARGWFAHALGTNPYDRYKVQAEVSYYEDIHASPPPGYAYEPLERAWVEPMAMLTRERTYGFDRRRNLDDYNIIEDVKNGWHLTGKAGMGVPWKSGQETAVVTGLAGRWSRAWGRHATVVHTEGTLRIPEPGRWTSFETFGFLHHYYQGIPFQTLALNVNFRGVWRPDLPYSLYLGGATGLRGYNANEFTGTRRLLLNFEDRIFTPLKVLTIGFGFVGFVDAGYVWKEQRNIDLRDLRSDIGFGIRFFNTRASATRVSRLDFAYRLRGQRGFVISLGSEQTFSLLNNRPTPSR